jgi:glycosyltransferase involved in cell wall biosynthesis
LFCGKFIPKKRPTDVVAAAARMMAGSSGAKSVHLLFVGSGELGADLRRSCRVAFDADGTKSSDAATADSRPPASFAGFLNQNEISRAYVAADVLVLPSDHGETWGLVVNEAMASGLPCIVSDAVGCGEDLVEPVDSARRFALGDVGVLVEALQGLARKPKRAAELEDVSARHRFSVTIETCVRLSNPDIVRAVRLPAAAR